MTAKAKGDAIGEATTGAATPLVYCRCGDCNGLIGEVFKTSHGLLYAGVEQTWGAEAATLDRKRHAGSGHVPLITSHVFVLLGWDEDPVEPTAWCYRDKATFCAEKHTLIEAAQRAARSKPTTIKVAIRRDS